MFRLDTYRLIKKTFRRFLSLTLIVLIGSGFMMGLMSDPFIMRESVDAFNDENRLQDIQIYSQYGFCFDDYIALKKNPQVEEIFPSKMIDTLCTDRNGQGFVARICEVNRTVNLITLTEGRMPENDYECVVLDSVVPSLSFMVGEWISFSGDSIDEQLKHRDFLIVGKVVTPEYISKVMGSSLYKNQDLDAVVYANNANFISEYYTSIFLTVKGSSDPLSYTSRYENYVKDNSDEINNTAYAQQNVLKDRIKDTMSLKLQEARELFEEEKRKGQEELSKAEAQLNEANIQIIAYETELRSLQMVINQLKGVVEDHEEEIQDGINETNYYLEEYDIDPGLVHSHQVQEYLKQALEEAKKNYNKLYYSLNYAKAQYEEGIKEYTEGVLKFNDEIAKGEAELRKAQQDLDELPKAQWTILYRDGHYSSYMYDNTCRQMTAIGIALPMIFFLVAALVCLTTMKRLVDEQRGQIGIFVALGFNKRAIIGKYVSYALLATFIGCFLGILLGQVLFPTVIYHTWRLMYDLPEIKLSFPIQYVLLCVLSFSLLMSLVTAYVVNSVLKEKPASLMRPKAPKSAKAILLEKIPLIWDRLSFTSKITARNLFRYKSRFLMTVIGVAGCTGLLLIGWGIKDSISDIVRIQFSEIFHYGYQIYLEDSHHTEENIEILKENFDNEEAVAFMTYTTKVYLSNDDDTANMIVMDPRDAFVVLDLKKTDKTTPIRLNSDGVIVSEKFARNHHIRKGDYITLESRNGIKAEVRVAEICEMYFQHYIFMSSAVYENVFEEPIDCRTIAVSTSDPETLKKDAEQLEGFVSIVDFSGMISTFQTMIEALDLIIAVIIITAGSLAFVVLMNITQVNISERVREIATLKVLGFNHTEIDLYIFKEILLLTLIGSLIGLPLGVVEHHFIMNVINMDMIMFGMNVKVPSFLYAFVITFLFTGIVLLYMRKPLKKIDMVESLKSVE